ncbi:gastrula zinc finger protein XlCGF26.1-like [Chironomus tepperi]|uniref:gastrula zinc finger protein XlCGF26.1-like n=1 Tax=Chironomus tepperi TaxID=113505 RepID=UPI00391EF1A3
MSDSTLNDWQDYTNWCRLCGSFDATLTPNKEVQEIIHQIIDPSTYEILICLDCGSVLNIYHEFRMKTKHIQKMFGELCGNKSLDEINSIRSRYNLEVGTIIEENHDNSFGQIHVIVKDEPDIHNESIEIDDSEIIEQEVIEEEFIIEEHLEEADVKDFNIIDKKALKKQSINKTELEKLFQFKCHECNEEFMKMHPLAVHCKQEHNTKPQVECLCGKKLSSWKRLMDHKARHFKDENPFRCTECNLHYKTIVAYEKHLEKKHGENAEKFICSQCGRSFKEKQILKNHERVHLPDEQKLKYPCSYCDKKFVNNHCLKIHIARIHERVAFFFCEICGKGCTTKSDLLWHMDKHTQERNFSCEICSLKFKSSNSLRIHKRRHMAVEATKPCPICGKEFRSSAALSNHKLVHSNEKKHKCVYCPNSYKRLESLKCHLSTHTGSRPFSCHWCPKTFVNSANCRKHKLKEHKEEVEAYEAVHGKKGVSISLKD